jgi:quercetin dioxygenase-like cupin family protein
VHIPVGTKHWHGTHPEEKNRMRHLAITNGNVTWLEPVTDDEYRAS